MDALLVLEAGATKTATFQSTALALSRGGTGGLLRPCIADIRYSAAYNATGANAFTFTVEHSDDNATWYAHTSGADQVVNLTNGVGTAKKGRVRVPIVTDKKYVRLVATLSGAGTTPTITYSAKISYSGFQV